MYTLDKNNVREVVETCAADSGYEMHILYALRFMVDNVHTPLEIGEPYTTDGKDGISSGLYQKITGDRSYYIGFIDLKEGLAAIARGFAGDEFEDDRDFIRDATGEFINRINGEFVIASSKSDISLDIEPQLFLEEDDAMKVIRPKKIYHIPVSFGGFEAEMLIVSI
ncbi:MAG: chemotaxis protein CheX [Lachnospiraceae bacterium]|nr:chemotaxis protein CheX [Lachnospiraceae bacterium]